MREILLVSFLVILGPAAVLAQDAKDAEQMLEQHAEGSEKLADEQDELSADVQQLAIEQTVQQVIDLLKEVEGIMDETTDYLSEPDTGGRTIAAQTEIIEKIHQAAQARQQQSGGESGSAMMDMMERMMGKKEGEGQGQQDKGGKPGDKAGQGQSGESDEENSDNAGAGKGKVEERTVPKAAGTAGKGLPQEFQGALDAYNRGLESNGK